MDYEPIFGLVLRRTTSPPPKLETGVRYTQNALKKTAFDTSMTKNFSEKKREKCTRIVIVNVTCSLAMYFTRFPREKQYKQKVCNL